MTAATFPGQLAITLNLPAPEGGECYALTFTRTATGLQDVLPDPNKHGFPMMVDLTMARDIVAYSKDPGWPGVADFQIKRVTGISGLTKGYGSRKEGDTEHVSFDMESLTISMEAVE